MASKSAELAARFEQANGELIALVSGCPDAKWRATTADEQWSVAVVAHHVAANHATIAGVAKMVAHGETLPPMQMDSIHAMNAQHAREHAQATKAETLALLRQGGDSAAALVRGLSDEQLARSASLLGQTMSAAQVIERILIGHVVQHTGSLRQALGQP
jgi:uncharacterized protein (TIGR03083 family)